MATTFPLHPSSAGHATDVDVVHQCQSLLRYSFGLVPIIAGADKFTNLIVNWEEYLDPTIPQLIKLSPHAFMLVVGVIEIIAGILVFARPRIGGFVVMAWLLAIALQLVFWGRHLDIAIRDTVMAIGAFVLARLSPLLHGPESHSKRAAHAGRTDHEIMG